MSNVRLKIFTILFNHEKKSIRIDYLLSDDRTFNYSTTMFGGMSAWGKWMDIGNNQIEISYTKTTENILPENKILNMQNCNTLKIGETTYKR